MCVLDSLLGLKLMKRKMINYEEHTCSASVEQICTRGFCGILHTDWDRTTSFRYSEPVVPVSKFQTCRFPCTVPWDPREFCWVESKGGEA